MKVKPAMFLLLASVISFSGCGALVKSNISVFHRLPIYQNGVRYAFLPLEDQKNSLEFQHYQNLIRIQLSQSRYNQVNINNDPDVLIGFNYFIDTGTEKLSSVPIVGQTGVRSSQTYGTLNTYGNYGSYTGYTTYKPTYGIVGSKTISKTVYTRALWLCIIDANHPDPENSKFLYEAKVISQGSSSELSQVMPAMIKALFKEFPGESGKTRTVIVPRE